jgi:hypothetical protein
MKVNTNIGILNALIRITIGFTILAWATAKLVKKPWRDSYIFVAMMAAMKIAEGIVRYCPMTALFEEWQKGDCCQQNDQSEQSDGTSLLPYNPT